MSNNLPHCFSPGACLCCSPCVLGRVQGSCFTIPFLRASVSLLFVVGTLSVWNGSSEYTGILIWLLLPAAGTGLWSASILKPGNWTSGLLPQDGTVSHPLFVESMPALPCLSGTKGSEWFLLARPSQLQLPTSDLCPANSSGASACFHIQIY